MAIATRCAQCGQTDDHPKVVLSTEDDRYHHDCLRADLREQVVGTSDIAAQTVEAAESGIHGDELRAHIATINGGAEGVVSDAPAKARAASRKGA